MNELSRSTHVMLIVFIAAVAFVLWIGFSETLERFAGAASAAPADVGKGQLLTYNSLNYLHFYGNNRHQVIHVNVQDQNTVFDALKQGRSPPQPYAYKDAAVFAVDPMDHHEYLKNVSFSSVTQGPKGWLIGMATPEKAMAMKCAQDFYGKTIGFFERTDSKLIRSITFGYRIPMSAVTLKQLSMETWFNLEHELQSVDLALAFVVLDSPFHKMLIRQSISIFGFKWMDIARLQLTYPFVEIEDVSLAERFSGGDAKVMATEAETKVLTLSQVFVSVGGGSVPVTPTVPPVATETFITKLNVPDEKYNDNYKCYGDRNVDIMPLCESPFDVTGMPKRDPTTWDSPCTSNEECPYYNSKRNRGGCQPDGSCEMPVGVRSKGYRKVNDAPPFQPFCYKCKNIWDPDCCKKQKRPAYAFPNDFAQSGKWIPLMD